MFSRGERLRELFRVELSLALRGVKDPGLSGFLTVTDLNLSPDMKSATVYYSVLGSLQERERTAKALERCAPYLRQVLRKRLARRRPASTSCSFKSRKKAGRISDERGHDPLRQAPGLDLP